MTAVEEHAHRGGFHPLSVGHLVMGLVLLGLAGVWALVAGGVADHDDLRWLLPIPWIAAGAIGLAATAVTGTRRHAAGPADTSGADEQSERPEETP